MLRIIQYTDKFVVETSRRIYLGCGVWGFRYSEIATFKTLKQAKTFKNSQELIVGKIVG